MTNSLLKESTVHKNDLIYKAHEVSLITCIVSQDISEKVVEHLCNLGLKVYVENGRVVREFIKAKTFGVTNSVKLRSSQSSILRLTVPKETARALIESVVALVELNLPGRGSIFCQDMIEYCAKESLFNNSLIQGSPSKTENVHFLTDLSYVTCVLSGHDSGEQLARTALDLGVCVPLLTYGTGNDIRDQLGLIRVAISPDKELVHLLIPQHDSDSIIKLLAEESRLDRPGRGYIYQTPISLGLLDTRLKVGKQNHAASIDQIIAAIDTLKMSTGWRKRLDAETRQDSIKTFLPSDHCKISIISKEDAVEQLREAWVEAGAIGAITSHISQANSAEGAHWLSDFVISDMSVPQDIKDKVVTNLLEVCKEQGTGESKIQVAVQSIK